jgi:hypothetical protein
MKILEFGLPETFPDAFVPDEAAQFCSEVDGMDLFSAVQLASQRGLDPILKKLEHLGDNVWGFGLLFDGVSVPFMVKVNPDQSKPEPHHATH